MYAFYYAPKSADFRPPDDERPPLLVLSHGGPTDQAVDLLDPRIQFWTSRGFAVLDVNYGGSSGFGRAYRDRLKGQWGIVDVADCVNGATSLVEAGKADPNRLDYPRRQRRRLYDARRAHLSRRVQSGRELLRHQRHRSARARHAQVRVPISRFARRPVSGGERRLHQALADSFQRSPVVSVDSVPGSRRQGGPAESIGNDGRRRAGARDCRSPTSRSPASNMASAKRRTSSEAWKRSCISTARCSSLRWRIPLSQSRSTTCVKLARVSLE